MQAAQPRTRRLPEVPAERIIQGRRHWWFLGPGGVARVYSRHLAADGTLAPEAERHLRAAGLFATRPARTYILTVLTSTDCNLGCGYCFQNTGQDPAGKHRPPRIAHARLTSAAITDVLAFTHGQMAAAGLDRLHVLLFGGEPLLNPRGCTELLRRAADIGLVSASMISNATLLSPRLASELADLGLRSVQVTFDGDRGQHDVIRIRRSGGGTFDAIIENMVAVSQVTDIRWGLRVNVSHRSHDGIDDLVGRLAARLDPARCSIHFAWVGDVGVGYANELRHGTGLAEDFLRWRRGALDAGFRVGRPGPVMPCQTCSFGDGRYGAVVNADGTLASCWETAGKPGWEVGSVRTGYLPSAQTEPRWISCEDNYRYSDEGELARFRDAADARFLDYLDETGRL